MTPVADDDDDDDDGGGGDGDVGEEESEFVVDTSMAGAGALAVSVDGPSKVHLECDEIKSVNQYQFTYRPSAAGLYTVSVKFAGDTHIPGSPFLVNVKGTVAYSPLVSQSLCRNTRCESV